ncbi:lumenal Hsp70 protein [Coemansia sp. IMI 203386]|nr:lumenal Hsp70 protein [Coemansia sp. IMI 203386]
MTPSAQAAVLGIDFGTEWFTIALANPGRPLDLVLNRDANRQTASVITVNGLERTFGSNAVAIAPRYPVNTFMAVRNLLGVQYDSDTAAEFRKQFPNQMIKNTETGAVAFQYGSAANETLTVEEIVAMQLSHAQQLVKESEGILVKDVVLTVPSFFDRSQRQAMLDAATMAGLRTISLVNDGSAVALNYAMSRSFSKAETHLFYDMGAGKTVATVAGIYSRGAGKQSKSNKSTVINVHAFASDKSLGGQQVDFAMRDLLIEKCAATSSLSAEEIRGSGRAMNRLLKEAKRVKTILSVNNDATASVEGLHKGIDFRVVVTREELEQVTAHLLSRVRAPIDAALAAANLTISEVDSIVLAGGGTRAPFVQKAIAAAFGADKISRNVNAEEACVMGAVFKGATMSSQFRVRDMRLRDAMSHAVRGSYEIESRSLLGGSKQETVYLYPEFGAVGARRVIRDFRGTDLSVDFEAKMSGDSSDSWHALATAKVNGIAGSAKKLKSKSVISEKPEVRVTVQTNELGFFEVIKAEAAFNVTNPGHAQYLEDLAAWEKESASFATAADAETEANSKTNEEADSQEDGADKAKGKTKAKAKSSLRARPAALPETITEIVKLDLDVKYHGLVKMSDDAMQASRDLLKRMDMDDKARIAHHNAINQLESLIYHLRDAVEDDDVVAVTSDDQRQEIAQAVSDAAEWLEDNMEGSAIELINARISTLKELEKPIIFRKIQMEKRLEHISSLRSVVTQAEGLISVFRSEHAQVALGPLGDVLKELEAILDTTTSWIDTMESEQQALAPHDDPVLTTKEMDEKAMAIERILAKLMDKKAKAMAAESDKSKSASQDDEDGEPDNGDNNDDDESPEYVDEDIRHDDQPQTTVVQDGNGHVEL